jgi:hypothetical protein
MNVLCFLGLMDCNLGVRSCTTADGMVYTVRPPIGRLDDLRVAPRPTSANDKDYRPMMLMEASQVELHRVVKCSKCQHLCSSRNYNLAHDLFLLLFFLFILLFNNVYANGSIRHFLLLIHRCLSPHCAFFFVHSSRTPG